MCLYLPRHAGARGRGDAGCAFRRPTAHAAGETVLVVDDEPTVRMLVTEVLERSATPRSRRRTAARPADPALDARIDLLVTDVGLPGGMNGRQVADAGACCGRG
jgi:FixJ family two-component response regulator